MQIRGSTPVRFLVAGVRPGGTPNPTAAPADATLNQWGISFIGKFDSTQAKVAFQVTDTNTQKGGIVLVSGLDQAAGLTAAVQCVEDDSAAIGSWSSSFSSYLGWTYTKPANGLTYTGAEATLGISTNIVKIADPSGILGISTCNGTTTSGCGTYP